MHKILYAFYILLLFKLKDNLIAFGNLEFYINSSHFFELVIKTECESPGEIVFTLRSHYLNESK